MGDPYVQDPEDNFAQFLVKLCEQLIVILMIISDDEEGNSIFLLSAV